MKYPYILRVWRNDGTYTARAYETPKQLKCAKAVFLRNSPVRMEYVLPA